MKNVVVINTGIANLASICAGLKRAGAEVKLSNVPEEVVSADYLVLPGVGTFAAGMQELRNSGLVEILRERVQENRPTLAVCVGLQLLLERSEESEGVLGLSLIPAKAKKFNSELRVPQLGWNRVEAGVECAFLESGYAYFANSYRLTEAPEGWSCAWADYGGAFVAAMEKGNILACQFHPELSGEWGVELLKRWLAC